VSQIDLKSGAQRPDPRAGTTYRFGRFLVDTGERAVLRDDVRVPLTRKAFETLCVLLDGAGRTVTKETLFEIVWPRTVVTDATLPQNV
jgi:DNA-binding winged helix-turn-helix (wHTH) protein